MVCVVLPLCCSDDEFTLYGFVIFYMAREFALARRMHKRDPPEGYLRSGWNLLEVNQNERTNERT